MNEHCTSEMVEQHKEDLTKLNLIVRGNGDKEMSLVTRVKKLEDNFHKISLKLTVVVVLLMILISVQAPALIAGIRTF